MLKRMGIAVLGTGDLGKEVYRLFDRNREFYLKTQNVEFTLESVLAENGGDVPVKWVPTEKLAGNIAEVIADPAVDVVIDALSDVEQAKTYALASLHEGKNVVTANAELICRYFSELERVARRNGCGVFFGACCLSGIPAVRTLADGVQADKIAEIALNVPDLKKAGNRNGEPYAAYCLSVLASLAFHVRVAVGKIFQDLAAVEKADVELGKKFGYELKTLAIAKNTEKGVEARLHPVFVKKSHPLAGVAEDVSAICLKGEKSGCLVLSGKGGVSATASAIVSDVLGAATHSELGYAVDRNFASSDTGTKIVNDFKSGYYLRFKSVGSEGLLSKLSAVLSRAGISVSRLEQKTGVSQLVEWESVTLVTEQSSENAMKNAISKIKKTGEVTLEAFVRVEED
ncbi:MAG: hypothetical protein IJY62_02140 [Clostridia bacterium]|nr:hypothetical protein [Clostridia bacterium]